MNQPPARFDLPSREGKDHGRIVRRRDFSKISRIEPTFYFGLGRRMIFSSRHGAHLKVVATVVSVVSTISMDMALPHFGQGGGDLKGANAGTAMGALLFYIV